MFGLGFQELLIILVILFAILVVQPGILYLVAIAGLKVLKSPRRVLVGFWILAIIELAFEFRSNLVAMAIGAVLAPVSIVVSFAWLWLMGSLWKRIGLSRIGTAWKDLSSLHFRALHNAKKETA